jgi:hypothetical protein
MIQRDIKTHDAVSSLLMPHTQNPFEAAPYDEEVETFMPQQSFRSLILATTSHEAHEQLVW